MDIVEVAFLHDCILREFAKVGSESHDSDISIKSGLSYDGLVHEWCHHLGFPIDEDFRVLFIGKDCFFSLFDEAAI